MGWPELEIVGKGLVRSGTVGVVVLVVPGSGRLPSKGNDAKVKTLGRIPK